MNKLDKTVLLFETLLNVSDPNHVDRKINQIQVSDEYIRLNSWVPTAAKTQMLEDVVKRFNSIQIFAIQSFEEGLRIEQEIKDLDRRVNDFTGVNPYLANSSSKQYKVKTLGEVDVEINARGVQLNDFSTNKLVNKNNRRKVLIMKAFAWYREAKRAFVEIQDVATSLISRLRATKLSFKSLSFESVVAFLEVVALVGMFLFFPGADTVIGRWRSGALEKWDVVMTGLTAVALMCYVVIMSCKTFYKTIAFRLSSNLKKRLNNQGKLMSELEENSVKLERDLAGRSRKARKINISLDSVSILRRYTKNTNEQILEYVYCEADYVKDHYPKTLKLMNFCFVVLTLCVAAVAAIVIIL